MSKIDFNSDTYTIGPFQVKKCKNEKYELIFNGTTMDWFSEDSIDKELSFQLCQFIRSKELQSIFKRYADYLAKMGWFKYSIEYINHLSLLHQKLTKLSFYLKD